jgi:hypothetical protein
VVTSPAGGGGAAAAAAADGAALDRLIQRTGERIQQLGLERENIGLTAEAVRRATVAYEANALAVELLTAAQADGSGVSEDELRRIEATVFAWEGAATALEDARAAQDAMKRSQDAAAEAAERTALAYQTAADGLGSIAQAAISAERPLDAVLGLLAQFSIQALAGSGPFGGIFNDLIGVSAGGLGGLLAPGAAFGAEFTVPGSGGHDSRMLRMPVTPGETVQVRRPGERMAAPQQAVSLNVVTNVTVAASDGGRGSDDGAATGRAVAAAVDARLMATLQRELRPGGLLAPVRAV